MRRGAKYRFNLLLLHENNEHGWRGWDGFFTDKILAEFVVNFVPSLCSLWPKLRNNLAPIPTNRGHEDHHEAQRTRSLFQKNTDETDATDFTDKTPVEFHVVNFVPSLCSWWPKFNNNLVPNSSE